MNIHRPTKIPESTESVAPSKSEPGLPRKSVKRPAVENSPDSLGPSTKQGRSVAFKIALQQQHPGIGNFLKHALMSAPLAAESQKYTAQGRPFFFLADRNTETCFSAGSFFHDFYENEPQAFLKTPARANNLDVAYHDPRSGTIHRIGNLGGLMVGEPQKSFITCLCVLAVDSHEETQDEDVIANLCIASACFGTGQIVAKDLEMAAHLAFPRHPEKRQLGLAIASQLAAEHWQMSVVDFCLARGADSRIESMDDHKNLLDILAAHRDFHRLAKLLPRLDRKEDERFLLKLIDTPELQTNAAFLVQVKAFLGHVDIIKNDRSSGHSYRSSPRCRR